jgi:hypothetical protein
MIVVDRNYYLLLLLLLMMMIVCGGGVIGCDNANGVIFHIKPKY